MHASPWETGFPHAPADADANANASSDAGAAASQRQSSSSNASAWDLPAFLSARWARGVDVMSLDASHAHALAMRAAKHAAWATLPWRHTARVQYECLLAGGGAGAVAFLDALESAFGLPRSAAAAARGWVLPGARVGGAHAFAADTLRDSGDAAGARTQRACRGGVWL
jgi:hypothetical protein